ncbi:MAG TPA: hypothetical protein VJ827_01230 [Rubrobacter sp.]|nr:hypothetical protein [Rubrobacter sp.]
MFRYPDYCGHGGLPLNVEFMIRDLEEQSGDTTSRWERSSTISGLA